MTENLIDILKNAVSTKAVDAIGKYVGLDTASTQSGVSAIIPSVLAGLLGRNTAGSSAPAWLDAVSGLFNDRDEDIQVDRLDLPALASKSPGLLSGLFGTNRDDVSGAIAQAAGIQEEKAGGLLSVVSPLLLGFLTNWMKKKGFSFGDIIGNLLNNKAGLAAALPAGLSANRFFDFDAEPLKTQIEAEPVEPPKVEPFVTKTVQPEPKVTSTTVVPEPKKRGSLRWLLWLVILGLLLWLLLTKGCKSCSNDTTPVQGDTTEVVIPAADTLAVGVKGALNDAGEWVYDVGQSIQRKLKDGVELNVGQNSVENRLVDFIESDKPADKTTWFSFDRLYFESGSSTLKAESQEQLKNIAAIMKAYPNIKLKLGGYTDNTGPEDVNMRISGERAKAALDALVALGVAGDRLEAEGYGPQHPIASNDTPEGRAQNRRIDVRVAEK